MPCDSGIIGVCIVKGIGGQLINPLVRGSTLNEPDMVNGTTGSCISSASWKAPFLKYPLCPENVLAPSGNTTSDVPPCKISLACSIVSAIFLGPDLSTKM